MRRLLSIILILSLACAAASAQTKAQKDRKAKLERDIAILNQQLKETAAKTKDANQALKLTRTRISSRKELIDENNRRINALGLEIKQKSHDLDSLQERLDTLASRYSRLIRNAYRNRDTRIWYMYILSSGNLGQGFRRFGYLKSLARTINVQGADIKGTRTKIGDEKAKLDSLVSTLKDARKEHLAELDKLNKDEQDSRQLVASLNSDKARYQSELAKKRRQMEALKSEMEKMVRSSQSKPKSAVDIKLDKEFASNKGKLPWPADGPVVDSFGQHNHPVYTNVQMPFNNGINIALPKDSPVKAVFNGIVCQVVMIPGYNKCVLVQHGGYYSFYCKLGTVNVKAGEKIKTGQVLGRVDTIAGETQLHFELWEGRTPRNPESWLR